MATTTTTTTSSGTSGTSGIAAMQARSGRTRDLAARVAALRKEVTQLRKEWAAAQEESVDQHHVDAIMKQLLTAEQTTEGDKDRPAPHKSVQHVEVDDALGHVKTMASLSGITFTEVTTSVTRNPEGAAISNTGTHRTYNLKGTCHGLGFFLTFAVNEQRTSQTIERVAAHVDDICKPELSRFVQRVERSRSPQLFFQGFAQYARVNAERQRVVQELLRSYPEVVSVPTGHRCAHIIDISAPHARVGFTACWDLHISAAGVVTAAFTITENLHPSCTASDVGDERRTPRALAALAAETDARTALYAAADMVAGLQG